MIVFLIGMMGSGKTTIGKALAETMGFFFIDMDDYIEKTAGMRINQIFEEKGEDHFRMLESQALDELKHNQNTVIATGGGTPAYHGNMDVMLTFGRVIYLKANKANLYKRLLNANSERPIIKGVGEEELKKRIDQLVENRESIYQQAHNIYLPHGEAALDAENIKKMVYAFLN